MPRAKPYTPDNFLPRPTFGSQKWREIEFVFDPAKWPRVQMDEDFLQLSMIFNTTKSVVLVPNLDPKFKIAVLASKQQSGRVFECNNFTVKASAMEADCYGRSHFEDLSCLELDRLENNSRTIKGAKIIGQDNEVLLVILLPLKKWCKGPQDSCRDQDVVSLNQSLRFFSNSVAAGAISYIGLLDKISCELLGFTASVVHIKTSYGYELMAKSFSVLKKLTDNYRVSRSSYFGHWVGLVELYSQQLLSTKMLYVFPLHAFWSHSLLPLDIRDHDHHSLVGTGSTKVVDAVTGAFLKSKDRLNIYGCTIDDKVCEHPKDWRPEKFLDENKDSVDPYKMMAFGGGKRYVLVHS
ncbi:hypothetical protein RJ639_000142 [Escallonia herrerae]|uniref:non-specific serine/threonine protein kinase n=1 Tax=Escallonia herrerae TaxID=1293975 RepID=A0AA89BIJ1_9ASTE|nr:hypothetical protein RJ639_000142 [Escallonia herrerae]